MLSHIKQTAKELNVSPLALEEGLRFMLKRMKELMESPDMPKILINKFGTFIVPCKRIEYRIRELLGKYKEGLITKTELKTHLELLFKVRRRLRNEEKARKGRKRKKDFSKESQSQEV